MPNSYLTKQNLRRRTDALGYVRLTGRGFLEYEHRFVASLALGRRLKRSETVHHVNDNRGDNQPGQSLRPPIQCRAYRTPS